MKVWAAVTEAVSLLRRTSPSCVCQAKTKLFLLLCFCDATESALFGFLHITAPCWRTCRHTHSPSGCTALRSDCRSGPRCWRWWWAVTGPCHSSQSTETKNNIRVKATGGISSILQQNPQVRGGTMTSLVTYWLPTQTEISLLNYRSEWSQGLNIVFSLCFHNI